MPQVRTLGASAPNSENPLADFTTAVENNQPSLALHYAALLFEDLYAKVEEMAAAKTTPKRTTKKTTSSSKDSSED